MPKLKTVAVSLALYAALGAHAAAPIKVGMALDISGPFATIGAETRDGFNLAIEKLGGKLGGVETEFLQTDFAGNPEQANQLVARYLQRDKIDFFTGPVASNSALAVGPALFAAKVPFLSSNPGPSLFAGKQCNPYFFGVSYQNDTYDEAAGKVANERGFNNMVLIAPNYPAGKDHIGGFKRLYKGAVKEEIYTKVGQIDYAAEIAQIRAARPDAVFVFLPAAMGINFIKQYVGSGLKDIPLIAPGFTADQDVIEAVGEPTLGMLNTAHWAHDLDVPANKAFVEAFGKKYNGRYPTVYAAQAYDVVMAMDAAVREVGGKVADREAVVSALKKANFESVRGEFKYGPNNFPVQNYYLRVVDKDASGKLTNKLVGTVLEKHQDAYVGDCRQ
ncbi:ABC transporter substrate-binding protein [Thauera aromatica]|uniref:ABC transporter substrate-binding protein n=1 Tax=Thauera aromatica TaxID=59405 RepID=UPI001FFD883B|nr:ABC transporter substrate-binding protein [Thauera aromatica]MCK2086826.1 ABC transporter substrate-binding protein [Thauera aromatica]MCK2125655.1 ABC transporter substrate-binding protein [Thauera aromatica]